ncbi:transposase, partial [Streptococcus danieliae]
YFIAYIAKLILQLETDQQLLRQLRMNSQLRQICGFETHSVRLNSSVTRIVNAPSKSAYSRFVDEWIQTGIAELYELLPDFGQVLALDGKIIDSYATPNGRKQKK